MNETPQYKLDAQRIADTFNNEGWEAAAKLFDELALPLPYWSKLALKDEAARLIKENAQ